MNKLPQKPQMYADYDSILNMLESIVRASSEIRETIFINRDIEQEHTRVLEDARENYMLTRDDQIATMAEMMLIQSRLINLLTMLNESWVEHYILKFHPHVRAYVDFQSNMKMMGMELKGWPDLTDQERNVWHEIAYMMLSNFVDKLRELDADHLSQLEEGANEDEDNEQSEQQ